MRHLSDREAMEFHETAIRKALRLQQAGLRLSAPGRAPSCGAVRVEAADNDQCEHYPLDSGIVFSFCRGRVVRCVGQF